MSKIASPKDIQILRLLQNPHTRYEIANSFNNHYATTVCYIDRLEKEELIFVHSKEPWHTGGEKKAYLISPKGRAILRGYDEAERRE